MTSCIHVEVSVPDDGPQRRAALDTLNTALASIPAHGFAEICIDHCVFPTLMALVNGPRAWLMCLRYEGDAGFSSRNPEYDGEPTEPVAYLLSNGQQDEYPAGWTYPMSRISQAAIFFAEHRRVPDWIEWSNDSEDGSKSPNDPYIEQT